MSSQDWVIFIRLSSFSLQSRKNGNQEMFEFTAIPNRQSDHTISFENVVYNLNYILALLLLHLQQVLTNSSTD